MLDQLTITKTLDEVAEANQAGQDCHHPRVSEAQCWGIETIFSIGRSGDLVEGHHVGGWQSLCAFGVTQAPVGGFANSPEGIPVGRADSAPDSEVLGIADHGFGAQRPPLFEVLLDTGGFVITAQRGIDAFGQYPSPEWTRCRAVESPIKDQHDLIGSTDVEVIANDPFKPHPASLRSVKYIGVGDLKLAEG